MILLRIGGQLLLLLLLEGMMAWREHLAQAAKAAAEAEAAQGHPLASGSGAAPGHPFLPLGGDDDGGFEELASNHSDDGFWPDVQTSNDEFDVVEPSPFTDLIDGTLNEAGTARAIDRLLMQARSTVAPMLLPWEGNTWLASLLQPGSLVPPAPESHLVPWVVRPAPALPIAGTSAAATTPLLQDRKRPRQADWAVEVEERRQFALKVWQRVIRNYEAFSTLGRQLQKAKHEARGEILQDTFASKATSTIRARGISLAQHLRWCEAGNGAPFPLSEAQVYSYFTYCRKIGVPATRLSRFREALCFAKHQVGLQVPDSVLQRG